MAAVHESDVAATELERVLPKVQVVYESDDTFYSHIKKRNVEVVSYREMRAPMELRPGGKFHYFNPDGGDLGRGGGPKQDKASLRPVFMAENIEYTKLVQWSTNDRRKAIVDAVRRLTAGAIVELKRQIDAQLMGDGTGVVGTILVATTLNNVDTYTLTSDYGAKLVRFEQTVQIYSADLLTFRGKAEITFHDTGNKQVQVTPAIPGVIATDVLVVDGLSTPASRPALYGVEYHHDSSSVGDWLGFDRSVTPEIRSNRINAGNAPLTLPLARLAMNKIGDRLGKDKNFDAAAWTHPAQAAAYEEIGMLISSIQKGNNEGGLNLYFGDNMQLAGAPIKTHFSWNKTRIDFIVASVWGRAEILPIGFYTSDGRKIFELRGASGGVATADIFYMVNGFQTFLTNPAATSYIDNLAIPAGY